MSFFRNLFNKPQKHNAQEIIDEVYGLIVKGRNNYFPPDFGAYLRNQRSTDIAEAISKIDAAFKEGNGEAITKTSLLIREEIKNELERRGELHLIETD
jgi:hypothetical protein